MIATIISYSSLAQIHYIEVTFNKYDAIRLLQMPDRSVTSEDDWMIISALVNNLEMTTDEEKLQLIRKPNNIYEYAILYPHMETLSNGKVTLLHFNPKRGEI